MPSYTRAAGTIYLQETTTSQLDSVSGSADTTQVSSCQNIEIRYSNQMQKHVSCDGAVKWFESPADISGRIEQLFGFGELLAGVIGVDSNSAGTYTITKYSQFSPEFTIHTKSTMSASQEFNFNLTGVKFDEFVLNVNGEGIFITDVKFVASNIGTVNYKGGP